MLTLRMASPRLQPSFSMRAFTSASNPGLAASCSSPARGVAGALSWAERSASSLSCMLSFWASLPTSAANAFCMALACSGLMPLAARSRSVSALCSPKRHAARDSMRSSSADAPSARAASAALAACAACSCSSSARSAATASGCCSLSSARVMSKPSLMWVIKASREQTRSTSPVLRASVPVNILPSAMASAFSRLTLRPRSTACRKSS